MNLNRVVPKIVIVGAFGRLGSELSSRYHERFDVVRIGREQMDLASPASIAAALESHEFDLLFLPAALTNVDYRESHKDESYALNASAPGHIARMCQKKGARMVHFSTDFVFSGAEPGLYAETDTVRPINVYGASKLAGEEEVLAVDPKNLVVRLSWLYGASKPAFPEWIIDKALSETRLSLPAEKLGCPSRCEDIVNLLDPLVFHSGEAASGIFHLCNTGVCSWQEWGQTCVNMAREMGFPIRADHIEPTTLDSIEAFVAKRPVNSAMCSLKYQQVTGKEPRCWSEALREHLQARSHRGQMCA